MYFESVEPNRTKLWIINSLLDLLERKEYASITINMIADNAQLGSMSVAKKVKHFPDVIPLESLGKLYAKYNYEFTIKLSGLWKATILWCEESPRKSPQEMAEIITHLLK